MAQLAKDMIASEDGRDTDGCYKFEYVVRLARPADFCAVQQVEIRAAQRFVDIGLEFIAHAPPLPVERLVDYQAAGGLHVLTADESIVGMAAHTLQDGAGYLAELDVLPEHAGQRLGTLLLATVEGCLRATGVKSLWLITYRDVPWNGPYYQQLGFTESLPPTGSQVGVRLQNERAGPLGVQARVAMYKPLPA